MGSCPNPHLVLDNCDTGYREGFVRKRRWQVHWYWIFNIPCFNSNCVCVHEREREREREGREEGREGGRKEGREEGREGEIRLLKTAALLLKRGGESVYTVLQCYKIHTSKCLYIQLIAKGESLILNSSLIAQKNQTTINHISL